MQVTNKIENGVLTIYLEGHIDSSNAPEAEKLINEALEKQGSGAVVIDAEKLEYISSAGLRVILRVKKARNDLKMINVSSDVYEVFETTGFTEMMDIQKAYRVLSVDGCEQIGQGSNGVVYRLDADTIIKVYRNPDSLPDIHRERELAKKAFIMGIPTAIPFDVVRVGNSYGSVFELLNAKSFAKVVMADPGKLDETVEEFVRLLKQIHSTELKPGEMPDTKKVALGWVKDLKGAIPEEQYNKLNALIEAVPERLTMMHGDYHFKNVMVQNGETLLIDMDTLSTGHPVFEFASIYLANVGFGEVNHDNTLQFMGMPFELTSEIWNKTLKLYFGTDDEKELQKYSDKARVVGYTRLLRRTLRREPDNTAVIENSKKQLGILLDRVDSLDF